MPKISPTTAGEILEMPAQTVRIFMQREKLPIGIALHRRNWTYDIRTSHLAEYLRVPVERINEAVKTIYYYRKKKKQGIITHEQYKVHLEEIRKAIEREEGDGTVYDMPELRGAS